MDLTLKEISDLISAISTEADSTEKAFLLDYYNALKELFLLDLSYPSLN